MTALPAWNSDRGSWTITSTLMCGPAWQPVAIEKLWKGAPNRGKTRVVPDVAGSIAFAMVAAERTLDVELLITGSVNQAGVAHSDPVEGFVANVDSIWALVTPPTPPTITRTSTLTMPNASTRTAAIVVEDFDYSRETGFSTLGRGVLTITIPAGAHYTP